MMQDTIPPSTQSVLGPSGVATGHDIEVTQFIAKIMTLHGTLSQLTDLRPSSIVDELFGELVGLCTQTLSSKHTQEILQNRYIQYIKPSLRLLCSIAECHLESHWASQITGTAKTNDGIGEYERLKEFPYYENYVDLARMELSALNAIDTTQPSKIAFVGSGPLPLSSLCLIHALDKASSNSTTVLNIDNNAEAISQSRALAKQLGTRAQGMQFICQEAESSLLDLRAFDVVYLAALVGMTQAEKEQVLLEVVKGMKVGGVLVIRSAHGLRSLLYPEFDATTEAVLGCLEICLVVHPYNHVVNSVIVGRVKPESRTAMRL